MLSASTFATLATLALGVSALPATSVSTTDLASCSSFPFNYDLLASDGNQKVLKPNGDFYAVDILRGNGKWLSPTRYAVLVAGWGNRWWLADLLPSGLKATTVLANQVSDLNELISYPTSGLEPWTPPSDYVPEGNVHISENNHGKVIKPNGDFIVNGKQLGTGRWETKTRFIVFVESWGNLWWVGDLNKDGMVTATVKTEAEALTHEPKHQEYWTKFVKFYRGASIYVSDGNKKEIKPNGDFWVNGSKLGRGHWASPTRYVVFVQQWGNRWWIGDLVDGGMNTMTVLATADIKDAAPSHLEKYNFPAGQGIGC